MSLETDFFHALDEPLDAVNLRRVFLLLMQFHFSDAANYGAAAERMGGLTYQEHPEDKTAPVLHVMLAHTYGVDKLGPNTAVYVGFSPFLFAKKVIDNYESSSDDNSADHFVMRCSTSLQLTHCAANADQALLIGQASAAFLMGIRPMLMQRLQLASFDIAQLAGPAVKGVLPDRYFDVSLECPLVFDFAMTTNLESHRIKKFAMSLTTE